MEVGIVNNKILPKATKAMDMLFFICYAVARRRSNFGFSGNRDPIMKGTNLASII